MRVGRDRVASAARRGPSPLRLVVFLGVSTPAFADDPAPTPEAPAPDAPAPDAPAPAPAPTEGPATPDAPMVAPETPAEPNKRASPWTFTNDAKVRYWRVPQRLVGFEDRRVLDYVEQVDRIVAQWHPTDSAWTGFVQLDQVSLWGNRYYLDDVLYTERELLDSRVFNPFPGSSYANFEKVRVKWEKQGAAVEFGDTYAAFGRGLALNVNRNVDIDIDTSIQGVRGLFRPGMWDITVLAGTMNRQQVFQDNPNLSSRPDVRHLVAGVSAVRYGVGPANIGAHATMFDFVTATGFAGMGEYAGPDGIVGGASIEALGVAGLDIYAEGDAAFYPTKALWGGADPTPGYALYTSVAAYIGRTTWLFEGKRYYDFDRLNALVANELYRVSVPPTLEYERVITEDSSASVGSNDIWGGRLKMDWTAIPGKLVPYAAVAVYRDVDTSGLHFNSVPETIVHPVIGVELVGTKSVLVLANGGFRYDDRDGTEFGHDSQLHADVDVKYTSPKDLAIDLNWYGEAFHWGKNAFEQHDYVEWSSAISVGNHGGKYMLTLYNDYTTNPLVTSVGNLFPTTAPEWYGALEGQWMPSPAVTVKLFYGAYKAGIRCSGGQCRQLPGFDGGRLTVTAAF